MGLSRGVTEPDLGFTGIPLAARGEWTMAEAGDPGRRVACKGVCVSRGSEKYSDSG